MFPILKTKKEIEELKERGMVEGKDFEIGCSYGITKGFEWLGDKEEERWAIKFPNILT